MTVGAVIPRSNEEPSIGLTRPDLLSLRQDGTCVVDDIVVCDNGSDGRDGEVPPAAAPGLYEPSPGYGAASPCRHRGA